MKQRVTVLALIRIAAITAAVGCGGDRGKMRVDSPVTPYQKPDISEITGIEEPDSDADSGSGSAAVVPGK